MSNNFRIKLDEAVRQLRDTGVGVIPNFWNKREIEETKSIVNRLIEQDIETFRTNRSANQRSIFETGSQQVLDDNFLNSVDKVSYFYEQQLDSNGLPSVNKIGHGLHHANPYFFDLTRSEKFNQIAQELSFYNPIIAQSMIILKNAKTGGKVHAHKDASFLYTEPETKLVGIWIPLEACDQTNGCLWYVPGSHRDQKCKRMVRKDACDPNDPFLKMANDPKNRCVIVDRHLEKEYPPEAFVPLELEAGSCVLIDGFVVHQSDENKSDRSRPAFTMHILDCGPEVVWSKGNWLQPTCEYQFPYLYETKSNEP